ncbi:MAG: hypothetical protein BWK76_15360 [Desulfobulbaceae bacterium A2]|nr:MAG: hypothetical protein BWK76_15360 [Desulfobulbaceae bacterium A2]
MSHHDILTTSTTHGLKRMAGRLSVVSGLCLALLLTLFAPAHAVDDDIPFFVGVNGAPNIMFIFDNSDSMQDIPYLKPDGNTVRPSDWAWRRGVKLNADNTVMVVSGTVQYDEDAFVSDEEMALPKQVPQNLPGPGSLSSTVTNITNSSRIYDNTLTATLDSTFFATNYQYRTVVVRDKNGDEQARFLSGISGTAPNKYFTFEGGVLTYSSTLEPYTYTILADGPGKVTRTTSNLYRVTDADIDWSTVNANWTGTWRYRTLVVTAGTNAGFSSRITGYSTSSKYWSVEDAFPVACDLTTRYKIIGTPDDNRLASGGNHPASKLYQAKKALNLFLGAEKLKTCDTADADGHCLNYRYLVNLGFASYLSARVPQVTAKYYRLQPASTTTTTTTDRSVITGYYKKQSDTSADFYHPNLNTSFESTGWKTNTDGGSSWTSSQTHTGVSVGYQFYRLYPERAGQCNEQLIHYKVTSITAAPTDSLPNRYKFTVQSRVAQGDEGGYTAYQSRSFTVDNPGGAITCATLLATYPPASDSGWTLVTSGQPCYTAPTCTYYAGGTTTTTIPAYYVTTYRSTSGWYDISDPATPGYVDRLTNLVLPYYGYSGSGTTAKTSPDPEAGDYTLVTPERAAALVGVNIGWSAASGFTTGNITSNIFDSSYFRYPGNQTVAGEDADHPHGWSYKKTALSWIYARGTSNWTTWGDSVQNANYFPASVGDEQANFTGADQVVFVNLPPYDEHDDYFGADVTGVNVAKVLGYTALTRVENPDERSPTYDFTMMPYSSSLAINSATQVTGTGTPIAATLRDAKKYFASYIAQDPLCQGGCRDNYIIFLTDGLETCTGDPVAAAEALQNIIVNDENYAVKVYIIGLGLDTASKATLNTIAIAGGTEQVYFADNVEDLVIVLEVEITSAILQNTYTRSAAVVTSYSATDDIRLYAAYFDYPQWRGHLMAYTVDPTDGHVIGPASEAWPGDCDGDDAAVGDADAGCEMKLHGRGTVYTSVLSGSTYSRLTFNPDDSATVTSLKTLLNPGGLDIDGNGAAGADADAATVMRYTKDAGYDNNKYVGTRDPLWHLGDIYHSEPVVVTAPSFTPPEVSDGDPDPFAGYTTYKSNNAERATRIYVGANDGMLHAIRADNGQESWAYIPNAVLSKLNELQYGHRFTVDLPVRAADIYSPGGGGTIWGTVAAGSEHAGWHTLLASGLRDGGRSYFALDVTAPDNPVPVWEMTDVDVDTDTRDMGKTWSTPSFGRIKINDVNTYVLFVGGGLSAAENTGNNFYILDAATGAILKEIPIGSTSNHVPAALMAVTDKDLSSEFYGSTSVIYFGDTSGDLWKITGLNAASSWDPQAELLYDGEGKVFHKPALQKSAGGCSVQEGGVEYTINANTYFIIYGTGDEEHPTAEDSTDRLYEIADPPLVSAADPAVTLRKVWERQFDTAEKLLSDPVVYLGTVYFTTYTPMGGCNMGESFLYGLTVTKCNGTGNQEGLRYDTAGETEGGPWERISLGSGIAASPTPGGPRMYISMTTKKGDGDGGGGDDDGWKAPGGGGGGVAPQTPELSRLQYWMESF